MTDRETLIEESKRLSQVKKVLDRMQHKNPLLKEAFLHIVQVHRRMDEQIQLMKEL